MVDKHIDSSTAKTATTYSKLIDSVFYPPTGLDSKISLEDADLSVIAIDCEMVEVNHTRSALARVSIVDRLGRVIYDTYVKPQPGETITNFRTYVSGVKPQHITTGTDFYTVKEEVYAILTHPSNRAICGHSLEYDFQVLDMMELNTSDKIRDTSRYKKYLKGKKGPKKPRALKALSETYLGYQIQYGSHNSIIDARAVLALYLIEEQSWEMSLAYLKKPKLVFF